MKCVVCDDKAFPGEEYCIWHLEANVAEVY